jgi:hypothetical protein
MATLQKTTLVSEARSELIAAGLWYQLAQVKDEYGTGKGCLAYLRPFANFLSRRARPFGANLMDLIGGTSRSRFGYGFPRREDMEAELMVAQDELRRRCDEQGFGVDVHLEFAGHLWPRIEMTFTVQ